MNVIDAERTYIDSAANNYGYHSMSTGVFSDTFNTLTHEYYESYNGGMEQWVSFIHTFETKFNAFLSARDSAYMNASAQYSMWSSRIGLRYPDPPSEDEY